MYQRFPMRTGPAVFSVLCALIPLAAKAEDQTDEPAKRLICEHKEQRCQAHHDQHRHRCGPDFLAGRPGNLGDLLADLLHELEWVVSRHYHAFSGPEDPRPAVALSNTNGARRTAATVLPALP